MFLFYIITCFFLIKAVYGKLAVYFFDNCKTNTRGIIQLTI